MKYKKEKILKAKTFEEVLEIEYGKVGTTERNDFEEKAQYFVISELLKESRKEANLTQAQLAEKIGTKKSYISRVENGEDVRISNFVQIANALKLSFDLKPM